MVLHVHHTKGYHRVVVCSRDTDVLVLFLHHNIANEVWMQAGTAAKPRNIPINEVRQSLPCEVIAALPAFHSITGCDTTNSLHGHGKRTAWKAFIRCPRLLLPFGNITTDDFSTAERFVVSIYSPTSNALFVNAF